MNEKEIKHDQTKLKKTSSLRKDSKHNLIPKKYVDKNPRQLFPVQGFKFRRRNSISHPISNAFYIKQWLQTVKAIQMKCEGYSYQQIGEALNVSPTTISERVLAVMESYAIQQIDKYRSQQYLQIQRLKVKLEKLIDESIDKMGGARSTLINSYTKLLERESKLLGLDNDNKGRQPSVLTNSIEHANIVLLQQDSVNNNLPDIFEKTMDWSETVGCEDEEKINQYKKENVSALGQAMERKREYNQQKKEMRLAQERRESSEEYYSDNKCETTESEQNKID